MNSRNNNFALLHYVAACMVILGHMFVLMSGTVPQILNSFIHDIGVNILFVISGYLVSKSFLRNRNIKVFCIKRLMRIYPPLVACVVLCAFGGYVLSGLPLGSYIPGAKEYIVGNILMKPQFYLPGVFVDNPYPIAVNGSLWTLPIELACFLVLPFYLLVVTRGKYKTLTCFSVAVLMSCLGIYVNQNCAGLQLIYWATDWMQAIRLVAYFLWGVAYSMLDQRLIKKWCRGDVALLLLCAAMIQGIYYRPTLNYFILPYVTISFALSENGIGRSFLNKHDYVYGLYLWAFPVQQTVIFFFWGSVSSVWLLFGMSLIITFVLAIMTSLFVEEPIAKITKRLVN